MPQMKPVYWLYVILMILILTLIVFSIIYFTDLRAPHHKHLSQFAKQIWKWKW